MKGCLKVDSDMKAFNEFIKGLELSDLLMQGRQFTWKWLENFHFCLWGLPRGVSDHSPLLLMKDGRGWGPRAFRFLNAWTLHHQFQSVVKKSWEEVEVSSWAGFVIQEKIRKLRLTLKIWNAEVFGNVNLSLKSAEGKLHSLDLLAESRDRDDSEVQRRRDLRKEVWDLNKKIEWIWLQKSRLD
ncbi:hypothetical protein HYC85_029030 [Camellia sinensis]|uniref:Reverse transcriptase zinc-binding domain-containing protein n=1 Tax=Camellia sinensis TaxID=4442 RepID=A0A7J7FX31_CAMSI|nr:hypothetical protein HYC85_029030 [Camellia sinensis]